MAVSDLVSPAAVPNSTGFSLKRSFRKGLGTLFITSLLFTGSVGALREVYAQTPEAPAATSSTRAATLIQDELYFGRSRPGGEVSEEDFRTFLRTVVTPRFPDGLTVVDAIGQFRNSKGVTIREKTKILILIYPNTQQKRQAIQEIISRYKFRFQQESVLRVTDKPARVSF